MKCIESAFRNTTPEENLKIFRAMCVRKQNYSLGEDKMKLRNNKIGFVFSKDLKMVLKKFLQQTITA